MTQAQLGLLIGGIIPAILFGFSGLFQKISANQNITLGAHLIVIGLGVVAVGIVLCIINPAQSFSITAASPSFIIGSSWGVGMTLVSVALIKYKAPLAQVAPLYNMNTLVAVACALVVFSEWKEVNLLKLSIGTVLIVVGGILVST